MTIHRKVQAPDTAVKRLSELHVRKVREVETGGQPTPLDDPYGLTMNISNTGFTNMLGQRAMFQPIKIGEGKQMPLNKEFMS